MIRITGQDHFGLRAPIPLQILRQTIETTRNHFRLIDSLSPSDGQNYRTGKSKNQSILINLLHLTSRGLANGNSHAGIYTQ